MGKPKKQKNKIKVIRFLSVTGPDGPYKPWDECTPEEIAYFREKAIEHMSAAINEYERNRALYGIE